MLEEFFKERTNSDLEERLRVMAERVDGLLVMVIRVLSLASPRPDEWHADLDAAIDHDHAEIMEACFQRVRCRPGPDETGRLQLLSTLAHDLERIGDLADRTILFARTVTIQDGNPFWTAASAMAESTRDLVRDAVECSMKGDFDMARVIQDRCARVRSLGVAGFGALTSSAVSQGSDPIDVVAARTAFDQLDRVAAIVSSMGDRVVRSTI